MTNFVIDPQIMADTLPVTSFNLSELRLMNDRRYAWLMLIPHRRTPTEELHELTAIDQSMLLNEMMRVSRALKSMTDCTKINVGSLGNIVRQLHIHVIARNETDPAWPGPVWGFGKADPYEPAEAETFIARFLDALNKTE